MDAKTKQLLDDIDSSLTRLLAERDALRREVLAALDYAEAIGKLRGWRQS